MANAPPGTIATMTSIPLNWNVPFRPPFEFLITIKMHQTCKLRGFVCLFGVFFNVFVDRNIMIDLC